MALADLAPELGTTSPWRDDLWPGLQELVLLLLIAACDRLLKNQRWKPTWDEHQFSAALLWYIWEIRDSDEEMLIVTPIGERQLLSQKVLDGKVHPTKVPRIDLAIRHNGMKSMQYFGVEAKVLAGVSQRHRRPGRGVEYYVEQGMLKFVDRRYADRMPVGAMIGYVVTGKPRTIVLAIKDQVTKSGLPCMQNLSLVDGGAIHPHHYESEHPRPNCDPIVLHHLFFELSNTAGVPAPAG